MERFSIKKVLLTRETQFFNWLTLETVSGAAPKGSK